MHRAPDHVVALERARWLTELAHAVADAQRLACRLGALEADNEEARELYARLEEVGSEVQSLRFGDWADVRRAIDPASLRNLFPDDGWFAAREG